jgi:hypothetical protein
MSTIVMLRVQGDPKRLEQYAQDNADQMRHISDDGKAAGATRHLFAGGDGEIVVIDEWPDAESFQRFFTSQKEIPDMLRAVGVTGAPQISFYRKLDTKDEI